MTVRFLPILLLCQVVPTIALAQVSVSYTTPRPSGEPIQVSAPASAGLDLGIYIVPDTENLRISFSSSAASDIKWYSFSNLGAAYAGELTPAGSDGSSSWITPAPGDMGYVIEEGGRNHYLWLVDYSRHPFTDGSITEAQEQECGRTALDCTASADEIVYYSINGRRLTLSRDISISYNTLEWSDDEQNYVETLRSETLEYLSSVIRIDAPLCQTQFTVEGDRFLRRWGHPETIVSAPISPHSIASHTAVVADERSNDNETSTAQPGMLGGSGPCTVTFSAWVTDAALFHEWQFSRYNDFDDISLRASELEFTHTFTEEGTTYVRLYCANGDASCESYSQTYEVSIGASELKCPNAFSPYNQDGVNDVWKVTYSSIVEFECHIFNRSGRKMISLTNPSQGWDGRYGGKFVPAGAYYYVIKARGTDGKVYNLSGDINLLEYN